MTLSNRPLSQGTQARPRDKEHRDRIRCRLCGRYFKAISWSHLARLHGFDADHPVEEYKSQFRLKKAWCPETRYMMTRSLRATLDRTGRRRTKERLIREIRGFARRTRLPILRIAQEERPDLVGQAYFHFRSWYRALEVAGIDTRRVRERRTWSGETILRALRADHSKGLRVNFQAVRRRRPTLVAAALKRFRSWDAAVLAAGLDPAKTRAQRVWSPEAVLRIIRAQGSPVPLRRLELEHPGLSAAVRRYFDSYRDAVRLAGYDPEGGELQQQWTLQKVVDRIRAEAKLGRDLNVSAVRRRDSTLVAAAKRHCGGWNAALITAGFDPKAIRRWGTWTREGVVQALRVLGGPLPSHKVLKHDPRLPSAAQRCWGSWSKAVQAAFPESRGQGIVTPAR